MPNRMIRESCRTSPTLDILSDGAERMFWRLTTVADDYGRFEADPRILLSQCFPLRVNRIKLDTIQRWLQEMVTCGLVTVYVSETRTYAFFNTWERHQRLRAKHSKFPAPTSADIGGHMLSNVAERRELEARTRGEKREREPGGNSPPSTKLPHGEFQNVFLTDQEYTKLKGRFGKDDSDTKIENLGQYIASKGKKYTSHYATILQWAAKDEKNGKSATHTALTDPYADNPMGMYADWPSPPAEDFCIHGWGLTPELRVKHGDRADHECGQCQADARKAAESEVTA